MHHLVSAIWFPENNLDHWLYNSAAENDVSAAKDAAPESAEDSQAQSNKSKQVIQSWEQLGQWDPMIAITEEDNIIRVQILIAVARVDFFQKGI